MVLIVDATNALVLPEIKLGMWRREKNGGARENFSKLYGVLRNFLDVKEIFTRFLKVGGCKTLVFCLMIFFLNKNTDFCWEISKIFKSWGVRTPWSPHP